MGYLETILEYYLPGFDHRNAPDDVFFSRIAHLNYIRKQERGNDKHY